MHAMKLGTSGPHNIRLRENNSITETMMTGTTGASMFSAPIAVSKFGVPGPTALIVEASWTRNQPKMEKQQGPISKNRMRKNQRKGAELGPHREELVGDRPPGPGRVGTVSRVTKRSGPRIFDGQDQRRRES